MPRRNDIAKILVIGSGSIVIPTTLGARRAYYTSGRPEEEVGESHSTLFKMRPGEIEQSSHDFTFKSVLRAMTPPILVDAYKNLP